MGSLWLGPEAFHFDFKGTIVDLHQFIRVIVGICYTNRLEKQKASFESFDLSLTSCEKSLHDLDEEQLQKFSAAGSTWRELNKQLEEIMVSVELLYKTSTKPVLLIDVSS